MNERCFVRVRWDPASVPGSVRSKVGGFLRYIQHRDLHPGSEATTTPRPVSGLVKYVAYRDRASSRAELFGPAGRVTSLQRKQFAEYVAKSVAESKPQLYRGRDGKLVDRRRAVSRFVISPERTEGLDLERLLRAGITALESETGLGGLRWIAAIHRNTAHYHVHLVLAGLHLREDGSYARVDITKRRLTAMKEAIGRDIELQRLERAKQPGRSLGGITHVKPALHPLAIRPAVIRTPPTARLALAQPQPRQAEQTGAALAGSVLRLRAAARRYQRQMQKAAEKEAHQMRWDRSR